MPETEIAAVGTGSGAIAVTLALELRTTALATDISPAALRIAAANAASLASNIHFINTDLLSSVADASQQVVASIPPYVSQYGMTSYIGPILLKEKYADRGSRSDRIRFKSS